MNLRTVYFFLGLRDLEVLCLITHLQDPSVLKTVIFFLETMSRTNRDVEILRHFIVVTEPVNGVTVSIVGSRFDPVTP